MKVEIIKGISIEIEKFRKLYNWYNDSKEDVQGFNYLIKENDFEMNRDDSSDSPYVRIFADKTKEDSDFVGFVNHTVNRLQYNFSTSVWNNRAWNNWWGEIYSPISLNKNNIEIYRNENNFLSISLKVEKNKEGACMLYGIKDSWGKRFQYDRSQDLFSVTISSGLIKAIRRYDYRFKALKNNKYFNDAKECAKILVDLKMMYAAFNPDEPEKFINYFEVRKKAR